VSSNAESRETRTLNTTSEAARKNQQRSESVLKKQAESDYYSDIDEDYKTKIEDVRSLKNWIMTGIAAISFIASLMILIVLIHIRSKKSSGLKYLM
jgi:ribosome-binding protein aMBF1 (putative translation factor)